MGKGQELYIEAKKIIPGGVHFYLKGRNSFYPINGRLIIKRLKDARYGTWTGNGIST